MVHNLKPYLNQQMQISCFLLMQLLFLQLPKCEDGISDTSTWHEAKLHLINKVIIDTCSRIVVLRICSRTFITCSCNVRPLYLPQDKASPFLLKRLMIYDRCQSFGTLPSNTGPLRKCVTNV